MLAAILRTAKIRTGMLLRRMRQLLGLHVDIVRIAIAEMDKTNSRLCPCLLRLASPMSQGRRRLHIPLRGHLKPP